MASRAASSSARSPSVERAVPDHHDLDGDPVIRLDLALEHADALGQGGRLVADGAGRPALEQPRPELALLGPGQADHVLGIVGRALDEGQGLEDRVVDVGRHLGPLLGQGPGLALGHQVAHQAEPPRPEDHHDGRDDQQGAAHRPQRRRWWGGPRTRTSRPPTPSTTPATMRTTSGHAAAVPGLGAEHGHEVVVDPHPLARRWRCAG